MSQTRYAVVSVEAGWSACAESSYDRHALVPRGRRVTFYRLTLATLAANLLACSGPTPQSPSPAEAIAEAPDRQVRVVSLSVEGPQACAVVEDGAVFCWGASNYFSDGLPQLVAGLPPANKVSVGAFGHSVCVVTQGHDLWCWNIYSDPVTSQDQSTHPTRVEGLTDTDIAELRVVRNTACVRTVAGKLWCWSTYDAPTAPFPAWQAGQLLDGVARLGSDGSHNAAIADDGSVYSVISGKSGLEVSKSRPGTANDIEAMGDNDFCFRQGSAWECTFDDPHGRGKQTWTLDDLNELDCDRYRCCGLRAQTLVCWGSDRAAPMDASPFYETSEQLDAAAVDVAVGDRAICFLSGSGEVYCKGDLGYVGSRKRRAALRPSVAEVDGVAQVSMTAFRTCLRTATGDFWCSGRRVTSCFEPNDRIGGEKFALWGYVGHVVENVGKIDIHSPYRGWEDTGELSRVEPEAELELDASGRLACVREGDVVRCADPWPGPHRVMDDAGWIRVQDLPSSLAGLAVGDTLACAWDTRGDLFCWGADDPWEEVAHYDDANLAQAVPYRVSVGGVVVDADVSRTHACAVTAEGGAFCWGDGAGAMWGPPASGLVQTPVRVQGVEDAVEVACGAYFTCVRHLGGHVSCWGRNDDLQVALDDRDTMPITTASELEEPAVHLQADWGHACALLESGKVACWGNDRHGQLGACEDLDVGFVQVDLR